ncbi:MAG TPA: hypothetical protein VGK19_10030 [Capsulimonadaceae bacterium]|jgi:hypothetical protein
MPYSNFSERSWTIDVNTTTADIKRAALYAASGKRQSFAFWTGARITSLTVVGIVLTGITWGAYVGILVGALRVEAAFLFFFVLVLLFGLDVRVALLIRRHPTLLNPYTITISPEYYHSLGPSSETYVHWQVFIRMDHVDGDTIIFTNPQLPALIPVRAFDSPTDARAFYDRLVAYRDDALRRYPVAATSELVDDTVWPPRPVSTPAALPEVAPRETDPGVVAVAYKLEPEDYMALGTPAISKTFYWALALAAAVVAISHPTSTEDWVISVPVALLFSLALAFRVRSNTMKALLTQGRAVRTSVLEQRLVTDFERLSLTTPESSLSMAVKNFPKVVIQRRHILVYLNPFASLMIPRRAFGSDKAATDFARRMRDAIKAAKKGDHE